MYIVWRFNRSSCSCWFWFGLRLRFWFRLWLRFRFFWFSRTFSCSLSFIVVICHGIHIEVSDCSVVFIDSKRVSSLLTEHHKRFWTVYSGSILLFWFFIRHYLIVDNQVNCSTRAKLSFSLDASQSPIFETREGKDHDLMNEQLWIFEIIKRNISISVFFIYLISVGSTGYLVNGHSCGQDCSKNEQREGYFIHLVWY